MRRVRHVGRWGISVFKRFYKYDVLGLTYRFASEKLNIEVEHTIDVSLHVDSLFVLRCCNLCHYHGSGNDKDDHLVQPYKGSNCTYDSLHT